MERETIHFDSVRLFVIIRLTTIECWNTSTKYLDESASLIEMFSSICDVFHDFKIHSFIPLPTNMWHTITSKLCIAILFIAIFDARPMVYTTFL